MPRHRAAEPGDAAGHRPAAALQAVFRQRVRPRAAFHPDVLAAASLRRRAPALPSEPERHLGFLQPVARPDARAASSGCHLAPAWHLELEPVFPQPGERRGVRAAWCQALASRTAWVSLSRQVVLPDELPGLRAMALRSELALPRAQAVLQEPLRAAWLQQVEAAEAE